MSNMEEKSSCNGIKRTEFTGANGSILSLYVEDLDPSWSKDELILFFTFNNHKPISFEFGGIKEFPSCYIVYDSFALVIAALKYYHGMRYKGQLLTVRANNFPVALVKDQIQLYMLYMCFFLFVFSFVFLFLVQG